MGFNMIDICDQIAEEVISAAAKDLANPEVQAAVRYQLDRMGTKLIGVDVNMPIVRPFWDRIISGVQEQAMSFMSVAVSDPPDSVDIAANLIKEETSGKVDDYASKLKQRLMEAKQQKGA